MSHHVRLNDKVTERVKDLAAAETRTVPQMVEILLSEAFDARDAVAKSPAAAPLSMSRHTGGARRRR